MYFEVKGTPWPKQHVRSIYYNFRCTLRMFFKCCCRAVLTFFCTNSFTIPVKKVGLDNAASNDAAFDEFYLINYVFGTLGKHGMKTMDDYHLLSHFNHVNLADPIKPAHADDSILEVVSKIASSAGRAQKLQLHHSIPPTGTGSGHNSHSVHQNTNRYDPKRQSTDSLKCSNSAGSYSSHHSHSIQITNRRHSKRQSIDV